MFAPISGAKEERVRDTVGKDERSDAGVTRDEEALPEPTRRVGIAEFALPMAMRPLSVQLLLPGSKRCLLSMIDDFPKDDGAGHGVSLREKRKFELGEDL